MTMEKQQAEKLKRYLINSDPFLWGVLLGRNKRQRVTVLQQMGFLKDYPAGSNHVYSRIYNDLLLELGVEGILERIVIPEIQKLFNPEILQFFRRCWEQGQLPDLKYLEKERLYRVHLLKDGEVISEGWRRPRLDAYKDQANIFLQIDRQNDYVARWTVFAGLWFEEIEPLSETT
jgi:hypothetical protein